MQVIVMVSRLLCIVYAGFCTLLLLDLNVFPLTTSYDRVLYLKQQYESRGRYQSGRSPSNTQLLVTEAHAYQVPRFSTFAWWPTEVVEVRSTQIFNLVKTSFVQVEDEVYELRMSGGTIFTSFQVVPMLLLLTSGLSLRAWHDEDNIDRYAFGNTFLFLILLYLLIHYGFLHHTIYGFLFFLFGLARARSTKKSRIG
ncbi:hypothetical protein SAMN05421823_105295 [Catalinimonas alkaloidigena]|uniref:Uncharacterized protein n=1 Tax=Catalinimonas alkaloidigena TaxID=1075417 RepID=A0A1G9JFL4_9BACT|nr:hypothetical protein SAMN05421823_105295 [Catalinimonas alkaloidigena]